MPYAAESHPPSYYVDSIAAAFSRLAFLQSPETQTADVCIVGGGFTGVSTALHLARQGTSVILLEANCIGWGASGRNGGQVCSGLRKEQDELESLFGENKAQQLWRIAERAKQTVRSLISQYHIPCDYQAGIAHPDHKRRYTRHSEAYAQKLNRDYNYSDIEYLDQPQMAKITGSDNYFGGTLDWGAGHLHPLNFVLGLAKAAQAAGAELVETCPAINIERAKNQYRIHTPQGQIKTERIVFAGNAYLDILSPQLLNSLQPKLRGNVIPINNFIVASEPLSDELIATVNPENVAIADSRFVVNYYRLSADKRLLFGGGENYRRSFPVNISQFVRKPMLEIYPYLRDLRIDYAWGGTLAVTVNRLIDIGCIDQGRILYAQGYSGQGVALATYCGQLIAEKLQGESIDFDTLAVLPIKRFPGGTWLRWPAAVLGMSYYALRDKI